ncbi:chromodomain helicase DNA binding protein 1-like protein [Obelidium mucronatum]|nr:chromodomain helicase DNA binding protein 1-like protein [Obelidium mucronatum]
MSRSDSDDSDFDDSDDLDASQSDAAAAPAVSKPELQARAAAAAQAKPAPVDVRPLLKDGIVLRDYQLVGVQWMQSLFDANLGGGILADEMGLGKTIQTISFLLNLKRLGHGPFLVVSPLSVLENWSDEFRKFSGYPCNVVKYTGSKDERMLLRNQIESTGAQFDVLLITYEIIISDIDFVSSFKWKVAVIDEAHRLKNPLSLLHTTLLTLSPSPFKVLLTGTPVQNNLNELESLLSFSCPSIFGASPPDGTLSRLFGCGETAKEKNSLLKELNELIKPFMLRREKDTVLTLPPMKETILYTPITDVQKSLYKSILTKDMSAFDTGKKTALMNILMQLRKCCNHPYLFDGIEPEPFEAGDHLFHSSGKLEVLDKLLKHLHKNGHRVLIFSQMTHMLDILQDYLNFRDYSHVRLDGSIRGNDRYAAVSSFNEQNSGAFVFLLSTRAGGVGLNLTTADTVIFYDSDFNPMMDMQAAARSHRIGQTKPVSVIRLLTEGSVEEVIFKRACAKRNLSDKVIGGSGSETSPDDLKSPSELVSILRFGVFNLVSANALSVEERAETMVNQYVEASDTVVEAVSTIETNEPELDTTTIYMYQGTDYKKDEEAFLRLKQEMAAAATNQEAMSAGQRVAEQAARMAAQQARKEAKQLELWAKQGYKSFALANNLDDESSNDPDDQDSVDTTEYFVLKNGSITEPFVANGETGIIVHIVDDSGNWPSRGVFRVLSQMDAGIETYYQDSWTAKNLPLGSAHLLPNQIPVKFGGHVQVCLLVAQKRGRDGSLGSIRFPDLQLGLETIGKAAKLMGATVHLPRFGEATPGFDWYQTERIIRKCLPSRRVKTMLYYFRRNTPTAPYSLPIAPQTKAATTFSPLPPKQPDSKPQGSTSQLKRSVSQLQESRLDLPESKKTKPVAVLPPANAALVSESSGDDKQKVAFIYAIRDGNVRENIKAFVSEAGGVVLNAWDPNVVNLVVVADKNTKEDLSDGCKSGVAILTVEELLSDSK